LKKSNWKRSRVEGSSPFWDSRLRWASLFQPLTLRHRHPVWSGVKSGVEGASNGVMSGAEARLQQNSLRKPSLRKPSLRKNSS
jgi:hypothetical protein